MSAEWTPEQVAEEDRLAARRAYYLSRNDAQWLSGMVVLPEEFRKISLAKYVEDAGLDALLNLFAQFIGAAESVVHNCHETIHLEMVCNGLAHPDRKSDQLNLPTMFGAMLGAALANGRTKGCATCAFRLGTRANQCETTICDAHWCSWPGERPFFCHEGTSDGDEPITPCLGFVETRVARKSVLAQERGK